MRRPLAVLVLLAACTRPAPPADPAFAAEWKAWHDRREERLRAPDGWLALTALCWLAPGENAVPGLPGVFVLEGGKVTLRASAADGYTLAGAPVTERTLATDLAPAPDALQVGARKVLVIDRGGALAVRVWDADGPARRSFQGVPAYPADPRWRIVARWEAYASPRQVAISAAAGPPQAGEVPGRAVFTVDGTEVSLEPTQEGDELSFVFRDATSRDTTYGAGRFLVAEGPRDGRVVLDFNRAYDPPCAFTAFATCPLPRPENILPVRIEAGEKRPVGELAHRLP
jgi:uncharacterized protein